MWLRPCGEHSLSIPKRYCCSGTALQAARAAATGASSSVRSASAAFATSDSATASSPSVPITLSSTTAVRPVAGTRVAPRDASPAPGRGKPPVRGEGRGAHTDLVVLGFGRWPEYDEDFSGCFQVVMSKRLFGGSIHCHDNLTYIVSSRRIVYSEVRFSKLQIPIFLR